MMFLECTRHVAPKEEACCRVAHPKAWPRHFLRRPDWFFTGNHMLLFVRFMIHHLKYFLALDFCFKNIAVA